MWIIDEMKELKQRYKEHNEVLMKKRKELKELEEESLRIEGEHRYLAKKAIAEGLIDTHGNIIKVDEKKEEK